MKELDVYLEDFELWSIITLNIKSVQWLKKSISFYVEQILKATTIYIWTGLSMIIQVILLRFKIIKDSIRLMKKCTDCNYLLLINSV